MGPSPSAFAFDTSCITMCSMPTSPPGNAADCTGPSARAWCTGLEPRRTTSRRNSPCTLSAGRIMTARASIDQHAAEHALGRSAHVEVIAHCTRGLTLLPYVRDPRSRATPGSRVVHAARPCLDGDPRLCSPGGGAGLCPGAGPGWAGGEIHSTVAGAAGPLELASGARRVSACAGHQYGDPPGGDASPRPGGPAGRPPDARGDPVFSWRLCRGTHAPDLGLPTIPPSSSRRIH